MKNSMKDVIIDTWGDVNNLAVAVLLSEQIIKKESNKFKKVYKTVAFKIRKEELHANITDTRIPNKKGGSFYRDIIVSDKSESHKRSGYVIYTPIPLIMEEVAIIDFVGDNINISVCQPVVAHDGEGFVSIDTKATRRLFSINIKNKVIHGETVSLPYTVMYSKDLLNVIKKYKKIGDVLRDINDKTTTKIIKNDFLNGANMNIKDAIRSIIAECKKNNQP